MASTTVYSRSSSSNNNTSFISNFQFSYSSRKHKHHSISFSFSLSSPKIPKASNFKELDGIHKLSSQEKALVISQPMGSDDLLGIKINNATLKRLLKTPSLSNKVRTLILLNLITVIYASEIPVLKEVEEIMDPATFNMVRFVVSAIPFLPAAYRARNDARICKEGAELGLWVSLAYVSQALGLLTSDAGHASFISMLTIIVVPLLDGMLGAVIPPLTWIGAFLSVLGVAMLESSGTPPDVGDLFTFLSAIFFGIHMLRTERISRTTRKENFISLLGYEVCVVALASVIWFFFEGQFGESQRPWTWELFLASMVTFPWIPAIYTGVLSTGLCLWIEMVAMRNVSATETAIICGLEPVWGAGFAWFLLGERWGTTGWIGAALILGGSLTAQMFGSLSSFESEDSEQ